MGKFTDRFFVFPIKIYDNASLKRALDQEATTGEVAEADWIEGKFRFPAIDLDGITYHESFSRDRQIDAVLREGFDLTSVYSPIHGEMVCTWPMKKFEEKLNDFMDRYEKEFGKDSKEEDLIL